MGQGRSLSSEEDSSADRAVIAGPHVLDPVRDDGGGEDACGRPEQDPVDALRGADEGFEIIERIGVGTGSFLGGVPGVGEAGLPGEDFIGAAGAGDGIEIAAENDGDGIGDPRDALGDEGGGFLAGVFVLVIEVGVPELEDPAGTTVLEPDPGHHSAVRIAPGGGAHDIGCVRKPEVFEFEGFQTVPAIEDRHEFAVAAAIATESDPSEVGEIGGDVLELGVETFLGSDEIGVVGAEEFRDEGTADGPAGGALVGGVAEIVRHDMEGLGHGRRCLVGQDGWSGGGGQQGGGELTAGEHGEMKAWRRESGERFFHWGE